MKQLVAEFVGTFVLVFAGTGAIVINDLSGGIISHAGIALTFGLVVLTMIYSIGDISGAHLNPAVTIGFVAARRFPWRGIAGYVLAQTAGAIMASLILHLLFPTHQSLGGTRPSGSALQSFVLEVLLTAILMFVILSVSTQGKEKGSSAAIAVGAVIALEALFAGPISGASMNPARSFGPALVARALDQIWIYLTAPVLGALAAVPVCRLIHLKDCCEGPSKDVAVSPEVD
jgi:aquaporin NIP